MVSDLTYKKKIGVYSGSFNPIHNGHISLAEQLIENKWVDEVWFVISPCNPLKNQSELLDEFLRLDMVILAIKNNPNFKASDVEFCMPIPSYSIDTLHELSSQFPNYLFNLIIGGDNALVFNQWKNYSQLLQEYPVLVYPRQHFDFEPVRKQYPQMQLLNLPLFDISSTEIREKISQKKDVTSWLHPSVLQFIEENNLYQ
jgi:nicotinate-nucleotide adenylyltransferase